MDNKDSGTMRISRDIVLFFLGAIQIVVFSLAAWTCSSVVEIKERLARVETKVDMIQGVTQSLEPSTETTSGCAETLVPTLATVPARERK